MLAKLMRIQAAATGGGWPRGGGAKLFTISPSRSGSLAMSVLLAERRCIVTFPCMRTAHAVRTAMRGLLPSDSIDSIASARVCDNHKCASSKDAYIVMQIVKLPTESKRHLHVTRFPPSLRGLVRTPMIIASDVVGDTPSILSVRCKLYMAPVMRDKGFPL